MRKKLFDELLESVKQATAIERGKLKPSRVFVVNKKNEVARARARGLAVVLITHNVQHAYPVGDLFTLLNRGRSLGTFRKAAPAPPAARAQEA